MARLTLGLSLIFLFFFSSFVFGQETITLSTYYPAPFGVYRELQVQGNDGATIFLREGQDNTSSILLVDDGTDGGNQQPYVGFQNADAPALGGLPDCYLRLQNDNTFQLVCGLGATHAGPTGQVGPGVFRFLSRDTTGALVPGTIEAGEIIICGN